MQVFFNNLYQHYTGKGKYVHSSHAFTDSIAVEHLRATLSQFLSS